MVTMAMPSTPFGDAQALRRRFSMSSPPPEPSSGGSEDVQESRSRRLSSLTRGMSMRQSPRASRTSLLDEGARTPSELGLAPPLQGAAYPWLADPIPSLPSGPITQQSDEMPSPLRRTTSPLSLRAIARRPSLAFSSERRREGSITGSSNASNDSLGRQPSRAHISRNPSPLAEGSATLLRAPSFLRRGSAPDYPTRRGSDTSPGRASPAAPVPQERASPGLHAYPRAASPVSMQPDMRPAPPAVYADDMARSTSPLGMSELSAPIVTPRLAHRVAVRVTPATECINMFGPLQVTSHYSLSGTVTLELPPSCLLYTSDAADE